MHNANVLCRYFYCLLNITKYIGKLTYNIIYINYILRQIFIYSYFGKILNKYTSTALNRMNCKFYVLIFLIFSPAGFLSAQVPIQYYDFENDAARTTIETTVEFSINSVTGSDITSSGGSVKGTSGNPSSGTALERGDWPLNTGDPGVTTTSYIAFSVNTSGFEAMTVSLDAKASSADLNNIVLLYSTDGINFSSAGSNSINSLSFSNVSWHLSSVSSLNNNSSITFRVYPYSSAVTVTVLDSLIIDNLTIAASTVTLSKTLGNYQLIADAEGGTFPVFSNFTLNGSGIQINLSSNLLLSGTLQLTNGIISTGSYNVIIESGATISGGSAASYVEGSLSQFFTGDGNTNYPIGNLTEYKPVYLLIVATGSGYITVEQHDQNPNPASLPSGVDRISSLRYWSFTKDASLIVSQSLARLTWGSDDGISDISNVTVAFGSANGNWSVQDNTGSPPSGSSSSGTVGGNYFLGLPEAATFGNLTGGSNPLPVELSSFTCVTKSSNVILNWETATEVNFYGFDVERKMTNDLMTNDNSSHSSLVNGNWEKIGFVKGAGNSNSTKFYSFIDKNVLNGIYYYRLKIIDNSGGLKFSKEISANVNQPFEFKLLQNYTNPFNPETVIQFSIPESSHIILSVFNSLGQLISTLVNETKSPGNYSITFNGSNFPSGVYYYSLTAGAHISTKKFILLR